MKCFICSKNCSVPIDNSRKICSECGCRTLCHVDMEKFDEDYVNVTRELCDINRYLDKAIEETNKLAKTFGLTWLPIGIQPSEVDRFLKYFPPKSPERLSLMLKSEYRMMDMNYQIPVYDRNVERLNFLSNETAQSSATTFFTERKINNIKIGRIDHLDQPEGKMCTRCLEVISFGEICLTMSHNDLFVWHPCCFKCVQCQKLLIDYIYCWDNVDNSGPFCLRHFNERRFPRCSSCDELIFDENYASISDENYHQEHLECHICHSSLVGIQCTIDSNDSSSSGKVWKCVKCTYGSDQSFCAVCGELIMDPLIDTTDSAAVHDECNFCYVCKCQLTVTDQDSFKRMKNGFILCQNCYSTKDSLTCTSCNDFIDIDNENSTITILKFLWHRTCLNCCICNKQLNDGDEFSVMNKNREISRANKTLNSDPICLICRDCFYNFHTDICSMCTLKIDELGVKYRNRLYHVSCFLCDHCNRQLNPSNYVTKDDHAFCLDCYENHFATYCFKCKKPILGLPNKKDLIEFENHNWHEDCFVCCSCDKSLLNQGFLFDDNGVYCVGCEK